MLEEEKLEFEQPSPEEPMATSNFEDVPKDKKEEVKLDKNGKPIKKKKWWRVLIDVLFYTVFGVALVFTGLIVIQSKQNNGIIFGSQYPQVLTDSMADKYPVGTVLKVDVVDPSEIQVGDAVTFRYTVNGQEVNMTHEIFQIDIRDEYLEGYGHYLFYAHGTNTHSEFCKIGEEYGDCTDTSNPKNVQKFNETKVVGKVVGTVPVLTGIYKFIKAPIGLIVLILAPCMYLLVTSVIDMFKKIPEEEEAGASGGSSGENIKKVTYADGSDPLAGLTEKEKERLKKQMLEELMGNKGGK